MASGRYLVFGYLDPEGEAVSYIHIYIHVYIALSLSVDLSIGSNLPSRI